MAVCGRFFFLNTNEVKTKINWSLIISGSFSKKLSLCGSAERDWRNCYTNYTAHYIKLYVIRI